MRGTGIRLCEMPRSPGTSVFTGHRAARESASDRAEIPAIRVAAEFRKPQRQRGSSREMRSADTEPAEHWPTEVRPG